jgi:hypothetical protein
MARRAKLAVKYPEAEPDESGNAGYEVGYKKPPKHTRFQPGQSGNPNGRPAGSKSFRTLIDRELSTKVTVREGGRVLHLTKRELLVKQMIKKAIEGDHRSQQTLLKFDQELATSLANDNVPPGDAPLEPDDQAILDAFAAMLTEEPNRGNKSGARQADDDGVEHLP